MKIKMDIKEARRITVIEQAIEKKISDREAAQLLEWLAAYGKSFFTSPLREGAHLFFRSYRKYN